MQLLTEVIQQISHNSSEHDSSVSQSISEQLTKILHMMMDGADDINAAMISSVDGICWAELLPDDFDRHRFSAMSSALLALSDSLAAEGNKGQTNNVLIQGEAGNIFVMHTGNNLLLTVFTKGESHMGLSLAHAKQATENIACLVI